MQNTLDLWIRSIQNDYTSIYFVQAQAASKVVYTVLANIGQQRSELDFA